MTVRRVRGSGDARDLKAKRELCSAIRFPRGGYPCFPHRFHLFARLDALKTALRAWKQFVSKPEGCAKESFEPSLRQVLRGKFAFRKGFK